jgi:hypothetical protein
MTNYKYLKGVGKLTNSGVKLKVKGMYLRGRQFTHSALLLNDKTGKDYPFLHLLCLGLEIILKSALLEKDYEKYKNYIKSNLKHNLDKCLKTYIEEYPIEKFDVNLISEIKSLNEFYNSFQLKYAMLSEIFIDPKNIESELTLRFMAKLTEKYDKIFKLQ